MGLLLPLKIKIAYWFERRKLTIMFKTLKSVGRNVFLCKGTTFSGNKNVTIGNHVWIGRNGKFAGEGGLTIKDGVIISHNVEIWTSNHYFLGSDLRSIPYDKRFIYKPVIIGENVWVGSRVIITPGVTIGEGAIVGAGAVISKDIASCAIVAGNPAKIIRYRDTEQYYRLKAEGKIYLKENYNYDISPNRLI